MKQNRKRKETAGMNFLRYLGPGLFVTVGFIDPEYWKRNPITYRLSTGGRFFVV